MWQPYEARCPLLSWDARYTVQGQLNPKWFLNIHKYASMVTLWMLYSRWRRTPAFPLLTYNTGQNVNGKKCRNIQVCSSKSSVLSCVFLLLTKTEFPRPDWSKQDYPLDTNALQLSYIMFYTWKCKCAIGYNIFKSATMLYLLYVLNTHIGRLFLAL